MTISQISQAPGLVTHPGASLVGGALRRALNLVSRKPGVYEARRSYTFLRTFPYPVKLVFSYLSVPYIIT